MPILIIRHRFANFGLGGWPHAAASAELANEMTIAKHRTEGGRGHLVAIEEALDVG